MKSRAEKKKKDEKERQGSQGEDWILNGKALLFLNATLFNRCGGVFVSSVSDRVAMVITYMFPEKK